MIPFVKNLLIVLAGFSSGVLIAAGALAFVLGFVYSRLVRMVRHGKPHLCFNCLNLCNCEGYHMLDCEGCSGCRGVRS